MVSDLDAWYKHHVRFMPGYKHMLARQMDFKALNRRERLFQFYPENQQLALHQRMWHNFDRREAAQRKAQAIGDENHEIHAAYINKWEEYREKKIQLTAIFIKVLKKKSYLRRWLRLQKAGQIYTKVVENLLIRREFNRIKCNRYFVRIKWLTRYNFVIKRRHGADVVFRRRNEIRRGLNFGAVVRHRAIESDQKQYFKKFLISTILAFQAGARFKVFFTNLVKIQNLRQYILQTREYKYEFLFRRLKEQAEFLIGFYSKKKGNKKATKLVKNLKKFFDPKRIEDLRAVRQQMELLGDRDILACQSLYKSIEVRATIISH